MNGRDRTKIVPAVMGGVNSNLDGMTLDQAMKYLCNVAYWPMTEASGNAIDQKNGYQVDWTPGVALANYELPGGYGSIPTFNGSNAEGEILSAQFNAFAAAFPYNKGSLIFITRVPDAATWESATGKQHHIYNFRTTDAKQNRSSRPGAGAQNAYRNGNVFYNLTGMIYPALVGVTWDTATGLLYIYVNGEYSYPYVTGQVDYASLLSATYTRIGADTSFDTNKWIGQIGYFGISSKVITGPQYKSIFKKFYPAARKIFILGDSKSTGDNFWPGYVFNLMNVAATGYFTDGPRRYALGAADVGELKTHVDTNLAAETETPEFILINIGTNDARAVTITPEAEFKSEYNSVIASCIAKWPGVPIFCQKIYRADSAQCITNSGLINGYITDIVASYASDVYDGPNDAVWAENGDAGATYLGADHVHYSVAAHAVLAGLWEDILTPYL